MSLSIKHKTSRILEVSKDYFSVRNIDDSQVGAILINTPLDITESFKDQAKSFYFEFKLIEECPTPKIQ